MESKSQNIDIDNEEFQNVWKLINYSNRSIFMTGKAGTGKSTFLRYICEHTRKKYVVLAPTGIAAVNAGGMTMHSFFKLPFKPLLPDDPDFATSRLRDRMKYSRSFIKLLKELELIIIDEISMVRADLIDFIDRLLRVYCHNMRQPFAGKQLLFVGDLYQLEPVVTNDMKEVLKRHYSAPFFFNANAFREIDMVAIELRKVYRQNDPQFIAMLDRIRTGQPLRDDIETLNARVNTNAGVNEDEMTMTLATKREMVNYINEEHLNKLKTPEVTYIGKISGKFPDNDLPTPLELTLKVDAQVVFIKNDRDRRWVNGTIGKIVSCSENSIEVQVESGSKYTVEREVWSNIKYEYDEETKRVIEKEIGSYIQFPLRLAWALTVHKSQGLTFTNVIIDIGQGAFSAGQTYVALSRCRSLEGMTLKSTVNERDIYVNPSVVKFSKNYNNQHSINIALADAHADDCYNKALEEWKNDNYFKAFDYFIEGLKTRNELDNDAAMRLAKHQLNRIAKINNEKKQLLEQIDGYREQLLKLAQEYVTLGEDCREEAHDLTSAIANYEKAIKLAPDYQRAHLALGIAYAEAEMHFEAVDELMKAENLDSSDYRPNLHIGKVYFALEDYSNALDQLTVALKKNENIADIHFALADVYEAMEDEDMAKRHRKLAQKLRKKKK